MPNIYDMADTWNNGATTFSAIKMNVTDTASNAASLLLDLQVGGVSKFTVKKDGKADCVGITFSGVASTEIFKQSGSNYIETLTGFSMSAGGANGCSMAAGGFNIGPSAIIGFNNSNGISTRDTILARDAANTLAQRNGTSAQLFRIYNTYTDASNYERGFMRWASNVLEIGAEAGGTGTARAMKLYCTSMNINIATVDRYSFGVGGLLVAVDGIGLGNTISAPNAVWRSNGATIAMLNGNSSTTVGGAMELIEMTGPAAPATDRVRIYIEDNGGGKTRLMARFATGATQQLAIEP